MSRSKVLVDRVTARVFCHSSFSGGGNPVTVFLPKRSLKDETEKSLAQQCDWESVFVHQKEMAFYMPSGDQVRFCAHAALGGATAATTTTNDLFEFFPRMAKEEFHSIQFQQDDEDTSENDENYSAIRACLKMETILEESQLPHTPLLLRTLREHLGASSSILAKKHPALPPTLLNSDISKRPKTLIHILNVEDLRNSLRTPQASKRFANACDALDGSTGLYLYSKLPSGDNDWECRQFPRASGYPEDPATGVAAAALATSLTKSYSGGGLPPTDYNFYQGMSMDRPSHIQVVNIQFEGSSSSSNNPHVSFGLQGRVEMDSRDTIEVEQEE